MDDADDFMDFNPQVQILHQSGSSDENRARNPQNQQGATGPGGQKHRRKNAGHGMRMMNQPADIGGVSHQQSERSKRIENYSEYVDGLNSVSPIRKQTCGGKQTEPILNTHEEQPREIDLMAGGEIRFTDNDDG